MELLHRWYGHKTDWLSHQDAHRSHWADRVLIPAPWDSSQTVSRLRRGSRVVVSGLRRFADVRGRPLEAASLAT
jgi:hypothetical protein